MWIIVRRTLHEFSERHADWEQPGGVQHRWQQVPAGGRHQLRVPQPIDVLVANPAAFIVQKLLIQKYRNAAKQAQDALYIHDTIELFGGALPVLNDLWKKYLAPTLGAKTAKRVAQVADLTFSSVTDIVRAAARIPQDRELPPARLRTLCEIGLTRILG